MEGNWTFLSTLPPPSYEEAVNEVAKGGQLSFVDFLPRCLDEGGLFRKVEYESFRVLIDRANSWLSSHPQEQVRTCESIEFKTTGPDRINSEKMTYLEYGEAPTSYIRGLRLWIVPRQNQRNTPQQIGYINLVPQQTSAPALGTPTFESTVELIERFNAGLRMNPLPGRIMNIEFQEMKLKHSSDVDPDRSVWTEHGNRRTQFLFVIRIFYDTTSYAKEEIGIKDFVPACIEGASCCLLPKFEPFSEVVSKASAWCSQQQNYRICNVQSVEIKCRRGWEVDSTKTSYTEHEGRTTMYTRILRVALAICTPTATVPITHRLTCKTFIPHVLARGWKPTYETLSQVKAHVESWVRATGADVISAETSAMRLRSGGERSCGSETTFTYNLSDRAERWIIIIRLYINGGYTEPTDETTFTAPNQECCVLL